MLNTIGFRREPACLSGWRNNLHCTLIFSSWFLDFFKQRRTWPATIPCVFSRVSCPLCTTYLFRKVVAENSKMRDRTIWSLLYSKLQKHKVSKRKKASCKLAKSLSDNQTSRRRAGGWIHVSTSFCNMTCWCGLGGWWLDLAASAIRRFFLEIIHVGMNTSGRFICINVYI